MIQTAQKALIQQACAPFDNDQLREVLVGIQQRSEQVIDTISKDELVAAQFVDDEIEKELNQALARSERLRQSILKSAFEGKLVGWEKDK